MIEKILFIIIASFILYSLIVLISFITGVVFLMVWAIIMIGWIFNWFYRYAYYRMQKRGGKWKKRR